MNTKPQLSAIILILRRKTGLGHAIALLRRIELTKPFANWFINKRIHIHAEARTKKLAKQQKQVIQMQHVVAVNKLRIVLHALQNVFVQDLLHYWVINRHLSALHKFLTGRMNDGVIERMRQVLGKGFLRRVFWRMKNNLARFKFGRRYDSAFGANKGRYLDIWRNEAQYRRKAKGEMKRSIQGMRNRESRRAYSTWSQWLREIERQKVLVHRAMMRWLKIKLGAAFRTWQAKAAELAEDERRLSRSTPNPNLNPNTNPNPNPNWMRGAYLDRLVDGDCG